MNSDMSTKKTEEEKTGHDDQTGLDINIALLIVSHCRQEAYGRSDDEQSCALRHFLRQMGNH